MGEKKRSEKKKEKMRKRSKNKKGKKGKLIFKYNHILVFSGISYIILYVDFIC